MNTKTFLPLTAAALFVVCSGSMLLAGKTRSNESAPLQAATTMKIVDLPTVTVQATPEELAIYHANRIVDLAAVTVRPTTEDWAALAREESARIVDLPAVTVRPSAEDMQQVAVGAVTLMEQLATR